jgi:hypothetical protein
VNFYAWNIKKPFIYKESKQLIYCLLLLAIPFMLPLSSPGQGLVINEIMSSNAGILADEDGEFEDWIEILNTGTTEISLHGYGLSDQSSQPFKWVFPDISLNPNEYLIVFASGKDRKKYVRQYKPDWFEEFAPVASYWSFDEVSGNTVYDLSGNGHHGIVYGPERENWNVFGGVLKFNRSENDRMLVPNAPGLQTTGDMTISMWIYPTSFSGGMNVWDKGYNSEGAITIMPFGNMIYYYGNGTDFDGMHTINPLQLDRWTHIVLVRSVGENTVKWYQDGSLVAANLLKYYPAASEKDLGIGSGYAGAFDGLITKPILLPYAADDEQVLSLYLTFAGNLHTNFSISKDGESIFLTRPDGTTIDQSPARPLLTDISLGRSQADPTQWVLFSNPTPSTPNSAESFSEILEPPVFSHQGGYYNTPFELLLSHADPEVTILYSLDGSMPCPTNISGKTYPYKRQYPQEPGQAFGELLENTYFCQPYSAPIPVSDVSHQSDKLSQISSTVDFAPNYFPTTPTRKEFVVRARATKPGAIPSETITNTYLTSEHAATAYQFPVLSLTMNEDKLFDYFKGVYVAGNSFDEWRLENPETIIYDWEKPANYFRRGDEWEQTTHLEYFVPQNQFSVLNQTVRFRLHGSSSRYYPAKSLRLYAKGKYGPDDLEFPVFSDLPHGRFKRLLLRNSGQDWPLTLFRDAATQKILRSLSFDTQQSQAVQLLINGEYWGIHHLRERYDKYYLQRNYGVDPEKIDILDLKDDVLEGDALHYYSLLKFITENDLSVSANYQTVQTMVDMENFMDYFISQIFIRNTDWPGNNITYWRLRTPSYQPGAPYGHDGRWRWMMFDTDFGFGMDGGDQAFMHNTLAFATQTDGPGWPNPPWSTLLLRSFLHNPEFKIGFINRFADLLNTIFLPSYTTGVINGFKNSFEEVMPMHLNRWKSPESMQQWIENTNVMITFSQLRPDIQRQHIREFFNISHNIKITIDVSDEQHGKVTINSIVLDKETEGVPADTYPWQGIYFSGIPVQCEAVAAPGYVFSHWTGDFSSTSSQLSISPTHDVNIKAVFVESHEPEPEIIHYWHFNNLGGGTLTEVSSDYSNSGVDPGKLHYSGNGNGYLDRRTHTSSDPVSNLNLLMGQQPDQGAVLRVRNPSHNRELITEASSKGFKDVCFTYATVRTSNGATNQSVQWSSDGGSNWSNLDGPYTVYQLPVWSLKTYDLSSIPEASDNPSLRFKILFTGDNSYLDEGNNRFDNISLHGILLPDHQISFYPEQAYQGSNVTIIVSGEQMDWNTSPPSVILINASNSHIQIHPEEIRVISDNQLEADFVMPATEATGLYHLKVGEVNLWNSFTVLWVPTIGESSLSDIQVFPNPATNYVQIHAACELVISLHSIDGTRLAETRTINQKAGFNLSEIPSGVYYLLFISSENQHFVRKIIRL